MTDPCPLPTIGGMDDRTTTATILALITGGVLLAFATQSFLGAQPSGGIIIARVRTFGGTVGVFLLSLLLLASCAVVSEGGSIVFTQTP